MKKRIIMIKKVILCSLLLCFNVIFGQIRREIDIDTMINNEYLTFKLNLDKKCQVFLEIENTTYDTLFVRTKLKVEQKRMLSHIVGYEKRYKNNENRDSVYYESGALWDYYKMISPQFEPYQFEPHFYLFGEGKKFFEKLPPKEKLRQPLPHFFYKGEYYLKIQTAYVYRKKMYFVRTETNKIKIE